MIYRVKVRDIPFLIIFFTISLGPPVLLIQGFESHYISDNTMYTLLSVLAGPRWLRPWLIYGWGLLYFVLCWKLARKVMVMGYIDAHWPESLS